MPRDSTTFSATSARDPAPPERPRRAGSRTDPALLINELRELCESVQLAPDDSPGTDRLGALEPRVDRPSVPRPPTAAFVADELVRRLVRLPDVHARVAARLMEVPAPPDPDAPTPTPTRASAPEKELRAVHGLLDDLGCPRGVDDRPFSAIERLRWLLRVLSDASRLGRLAVGIGDATPATGVHLTPLADERPRTPPHGG
jgi:hypothetical protein